MGVAGKSEGLVVLFYTLGQTMNKYKKVLALLTTIPALLLGNTVKAKNTPLSPYITTEFGGSYGAVNSGSKTQQNTNVVDFTSSGSQLEAAVESESGLQLDENLFFVPLDWKYNSIDLNNSIGTPIGNTKGSLSDFKIGAGYGRIVEAQDVSHIVKLAAGYASFGRDLKIKHDILDIAKKDGAGGYVIDIEYNLNDKTGKILDAKYAFAQMSGTSNTDIAITTLPNVKVPSTNVGYKRSDQLLRARVYLPAEITLEGMLQSTSEEAGVDKTNYTSLGLGAGWHGLKWIRPYAQVQFITSGVANNSELKGSTIQLGTKYNLDLFGGNEAPSYTATPRNTATYTATPTYTPTALPTYTPTPVKKISPKQKKLDEIDRRWKEIQNKKKINKK